jgi:hypothetical protein
MDLSSKAMSINKISKYLTSFLEVRHKESREYSSKQGYATTKELRSLQHN